jgi:hypothetical protein
MVQTGGAIPHGCPVGGARVGHLRIGRHGGLPLPDGAMQWQTVGATPCGCPIGGARVNGVRRWADTEVCPYR